MSFIEARRYLDKTQALVGQSLLAARGIDARVAADDEGGMAPHMSFVTGVRLLVPIEDREQAQAVLAEADKVAQSGEDAIGDAWRKGIGANEAEERPRLRQLVGGRSADDAEGSSTASRSEPRVIQGGGGLGAARPAKLLTGSTRDPGILAFRASLLGFVLVPVVLHVYSLWHVMHAAKEWGSLSQRSRKLAIGAAVIDFATLIVAGYIALVQL